MKPFELYEPTSLKEATTLLAKGGQSFILAGGTDLFVQMKRGKIVPERLVSLRLIPGLSYIRKEGESVKFGAFTSHRAIEKSPWVRSLYPALADAVDNLGSIQVRNVATLGGNICNAAPSADAVPPLLIHDAELKITGLQGERVLPLDAFYDGPGKTWLKSGEILTEIALSIPSAQTSSVYIKFTRRSCMELPLVGVAARVSFDPAGTILSGKIALSCAGPNCLRVRTAESLFPGKRLDEKFLNELGKAVLDESRPRDSFRCSAQYRREMIPVLVGRAVRQCHERVFNKGGRS